MQRRLDFPGAGCAWNRTKGILLRAALVLLSLHQVGAFYFQSFETDSSGWFGATRVLSGTHGVVSKIGAFHAEDDGGAFTRWGGYSETFPPGGYTTSIDIYLDISPPYMTGSLTPYPNDTRFDWSSAISTPQCAHRRDFVFNAGFYTDTDATGSGPRFVISASNNAGRSGANPKNAGRMPYTIYGEGWYTFEHRFRDNGAGVLAVDLTIKNTAGVPLVTWTLSDPSDVIGDTVGGNRYGWFATDEFPYLAFDTSTLLGFQDYCTAPANTPGKATGGGQIGDSDPLFSALGDLISLPALIASPTDPAASCTFGFTAKCCDPSGNLEYNDHTQDVRIKAQSVDGFFLSTGPCGPNTHATITGMAKVIRSTGTTVERFTVEVDDCGEPGTGDTFGIRAESYVNGPSPLIGGNIQIHP
ncbi:MAG TPA: post-COAP-1 domain-containing protein [Verrucomicrobiae bacterium]